MIGKAYLRAVAQSLSEKWQLGQETPSISDKVENAPADEGMFEGIRRQQLEQPEEEITEPWDWEKETSSQPFDPNDPHWIPADKVREILKKRLIDWEDFAYEMGTRDYYHLDDLLDYFGS
jgi:hypothetical protein